MNVLSLFDGMSCGQIALNRLGIEYDNYFASEIDPHAIKVTQHNYPNTKQIGSVTEVYGKDLPKIDLLFGGSPCQGFSFAGKQLNFDDPRSALFFEFVRVLRETNPTYFLLENVNMKQEYQEVISGLLGVKPIKINSALVSAQNRVRLYWTNIPNVDQPEDKGIMLADILAVDYAEDLILKGRGLNKLKRDRCRICQIDRPKMPTIMKSQESRSTDAVVIYQDGLNRYPTRNEAEMAQTVPLDYTSILDYNKAMGVLGNGWTVDVIAHIFKDLDTLI